jgi:hypothetical protein
MNPHFWLTASIEHLETLSVPELMSIRDVSRSEDGVNACGSCLYGLDLPCECGNYEVNTETLTHLIEYKQTH